jgi:YesN/AraC family two-component response regulator
VLDFDVSGEAQNGQDAIDKAELLRPDLIILDLTMPVMNGLQAAPLLAKMLLDCYEAFFTR